MNQIRAAVTMMKARYGIQVVFIDYLQRIMIEGRDRFEKVTNASLEIGAMLKELDLLGIVLAKLNRENVHRSDPRPTITDLRESGQIEQDADGVIFLHRDDYYRASEPNCEPNQIAELIFAKFRDASRGTTIYLKSDMRHQRFDDTNQGEAAVLAGRAARSQPQDDGKDLI